MGTKKKRHLRTSKKGKKFHAGKGLPFKPMPKFKEDEHLEYKIAIIVPSTEGDKPISDSEFKERIRNTRTYLADTFGGYTSFEIIGGWVEKGKLIKEKGARVLTFADKGKYLKNKASFTKWAKGKKKKWKQFKLSYEFEGDLYLL